MALEERGVLIDPVALRVHRVHHAAADAGRARLDAPRDGAVPARDGARRERLGPAAAERVQAVALLLLHAAKPIDEFAVLEMTATRAVVMDCLVEHGRRLVLAIQLRQTAHQRVLDDDRHEPLGVGRAARDVYHRRRHALFAQIALHAHRARIVGTRRHPAAVARARAERDDRIGVLRRLEQRVDALLAAHREDVAIEGGGHGALVDKHVAAGLDGVAARLLHRVPGSRRKRLAVVERDGLQDELRDIRGVRLGQRLGAARARAALHPDDGQHLSRFLTRLERLGDPWRRRSGKPQHHSKAAAIREEIPAGEAVRDQALGERRTLHLMFSSHPYTSLSCVAPARARPMHTCTSQLRTRRKPPRSKRPRFVSKA